MKIMIACRAFENVAGGVERMAIALMGAMAERGHEVHLLTWDTAHAKAFYEMHPAIQWHKIDIGNYREKATWAVRAKRAFKVRKIVESVKPDVIMGFQHGTFLSVRLFTLGLGVPVIAAEREAPARFKYLSAGKHQNLIYQTMRLARKITVQCPSYVQDYPKYLQKKVYAIPNPVKPARKLAVPVGREDQNKVLLTVSRLSYQKNIMVLIHAFAKIAAECPEWRLFIAGEGEDRTKLENEIRSKGLGGRIEMPGAISDVESLYCTSHLFCLPALWEGFPNALAEALSHGLPAIGFAECAGVRDLIQDGDNGHLAAGIDNVHTLAATLKVLMMDDARRREMGQNAVHSMAPYVPELIFDQWEKLFLDIGLK